VRRLVAAFVVVIFTMLSTGDAWSCPDGCQSAMSTTGGRQVQFQRRLPVLYRRRRVGRGAAKSGAIPD
jgi:hypothetical protein